MDQMDFNKSLTDMLSFLSQQNSPQPKDEGGAVIKMIDLKSAISNWESNLRGEDKSPNTLASYLNSLKKFEGWLSQFSPNQTVDSISLDLIISYRKHLIEYENKAPGTVNTKLMAIKIFFNWAIDNQFCTLNPCKKVKRVGTENQQPKSLNEEDLNKLISAITKHGNKTKNPTHATLLSFMLKTGLRVSEVCNLRFSDVDIKNKKISVRNSKGGKFRSIPMAESLIAQYEVYIEYSEGKGRKLIKSNFVFAPKNRPKYAPIGIAKMLERYTAKAEINHVTPHQLRHTFATRLIRKKAKLNSVQMMLGHASLNTTAKYIIPSFEDLQSDVSLLDG